MKKITTFLLATSSFFLVAQSVKLISPSDYDKLKASGSINPDINYTFISGTSSDPKALPASVSQRAASTSSGACSCLLTTDNTYSLVPLSPSVSSNFRTDDGSSPAIALPFNFNYYGTNYDTVYINSNGNISFVKKITSFSSAGFPAGSVTVPETLMVAPFWADVDTRNIASGLVYYKITPTSLIVKWDSVGYYNLMANLRNTFQLIITNGSDPLISNGNNVAFCYGDMQWTTGDASGGTNGFGGTPATVGVNKGDGINYFQVGRFDATGTLFDGPYNNNDGIDFLDNQSIYFNTTNSVNIPPIIINDNACDTIDVFTGDTLSLKSIAADTVYIRMTVLAAEDNQAVNVSLTSDASANFSFIQHVNTPGYKSYTMKFNKASLLSGNYHIYVNAVDNGTPARTTIRVINLKVKGIDPSTETSLDEFYKDKQVVFPNPTSGLLNIKAPYSTYGTITNPIGEIVLSLELMKDINLIDISALAPSIYFLHLENGKSLKIVKQ